MKTWVLYGLYALAAYGAWKAYQGFNTSGSLTIGTPIITDRS